MEEQLPVVRYMIRKRGRSVLFFLVVLLIPMALAEDVKITFQADQQLYHEGDTVVVDVSLESNRAAPSDFSIATFQLFIEHNGGSVFNFVAPIVADNQNNFFNKELQNNEFLSVSSWSMGDTTTDTTPVTLTTSPVRIGSLRGTVNNVGTVAFMIPAGDGDTNWEELGESFFKTGTGPGRTYYSYELTPFSLTILNEDEECLNDAHCTADETCVSNQCQTTDVAPAGPQCDNVDDFCTADSTRTCTTANGYSGAQTCASDCTAWGEECTPTESCGDGTPNGDETCFTCSGDVGACSPGDDDSDGVLNPSDVCLDTPAGKSVYPTGSPNAGCQLGDINADGCIDLPDWNLFLSLISNYFENTGYTGPGDLTSANGLDLGDWNMFLGAMGQDFTTC